MQQEVLYHQLVYQSGKGLHSHRALTDAKMLGVQNVEMIFVLLLLCLFKYLLKEIGSCIISYSEWRLPTLVNKFQRLLLKF